MWQTYVNADSLEQVLDLIAGNEGQIKIIAGATDLILEMEKGIRKGIQTLVDITRIPDLNRIYEDSDGYLHLGAMVTHNDCVGSKLLRKKALPLVLACWQVGSPQIRNRGTIAGNLITASPANDTISPLMALDATLILQKRGLTRTVRIQDFYTGVRKTVIQPDEMLVEIVFPSMKPSMKGIYSKNALRKAQAISVVNTSIILDFSGTRVSKARITLGSVAPVILHAQKAEDYLIGKELTDDVILKTASLTEEAAKPIDDVRGSAGYRAYIVGTLAKQGLEKIRKGQEEDGLLANPPLLKTASHLLDYSGSNINENEPIVATINGQKFVFKNGHEKTLLRLLREDAGLVGTKEGCAEGECGACTVFLDDAAVMACLVPAPRAHGAVIKTIEGMSIDEKMHPVQASFVEEGAVQCGYCTPGFVMSSAKLLEENPSPTEMEIKHALTGNLCRCTGYYKIMRAVEKAARSMSDHG